LLLKLPNFVLDIQRPLSPLHTPANKDLVLELTQVKAVTWFVYGHSPPLVLTYLQRA
jgi:hypothetical protein